MLVDGCRLIDKWFAGSRAIDKQGITYGVSCVEPFYENDTRPELIISVDSVDLNWLFAVANIGEQHKGKYTFKPGDTINFNSKISDESEMTSFLVWHQDIFPEQYEIICLPDYQIELVQLFPIHNDERLYIREHGVNKFLDLAPDPCDVKRNCVV